MIPKLRYEFYLPFCYNDGSPIEDEKFWELKQQLLKKFRGWTIHPGSLQGAWQHPATGKIYYDNCCKFEITIPNLPENQIFFKELKEMLKKTFKQHQIYMIMTEVFQI